MAVIPQPSYSVWR